MKMKKAYLFDMDGVLVDNCRAHVVAWLEFAKRHGGHLTEDEVIAWMGAPAQIRIGGCAPRSKRAGR